MNNYENKININFHKTLTRMHREYVNNVSINKTDSMHFDNAE